MFNLVLGVVIAVSGIWVYLDATKNEIGKIEGEKGFFNLHAGGWALVTLLLWIIGFPAYIIKRKSLIEKAYDHPVEVSRKWSKIAGLAVIGLLLVAGPLAPILSQLAPSLADQYDGVWKDKNGKITEVRLTGDNSGLTLGGTFYPLTIQSVDQENNTISVMLKGSKGEIPWTIKGEVDSSNNQILKFTDQDGKHFNLFFVNKFPDSSPAKNDNGKVSCTNEEVKRLVLELTYEELFNQLLPIHIQNNHSVLLADLEDKEVFTNYVGMVMNKIAESGNTALFNDFMAASGLTPHTPVDYFVEFTKVSPVAKRVFDDLTQQMKEMNIDLDAIRVVQDQPNIKKVVCAANVTATGGNPYPIQYSAQLTEDGQIYVEVSKL